MVRLNISKLLILNLWFGFRFSGRPHPLNGNERRVGVGDVRRPREEEERRAVRSANEKHGGCLKHKESGEETIKQLFPQR